MSNNNPENNSKSDDQASLPLKDSQVGQIKESGSRIRVVDPKDTKCQMYDGYPPAPG
ncbi:MAG: hypothetical protein QNJ33_19080 [Crocosphaera sp.]|nr:hypothetical protein [Crocosphaera sp.]